jgi:hypothetical protein
MRQVLVLALSLAFLPIGLAAESGRQEWQTPNWDRDLALLAASKVETGVEIERLIALVSQADKRQALDALEDLAARPDWPAPAREAALFSITNRLRELSPFSVDEVVLQFLREHQNLVWVAHLEAPDLAVPLYPIRSAAQGLINHWTRQRAAREAALILASNPAKLVDIHAESSSMSIRAGIETSLIGADPGQLRAALDYGLPLLAQLPELTGLLGKMAVQLDNPEAVAQVLIDGAGGSLVEVCRLARQRFTRQDQGKLLLAVIDTAPAATASLAIAELAPGSLMTGQISKALLDMLEHPDLGSAAALALVRWGSHQQRESLRAKMTQSSSGLAARRLRLAFALDQANPHREIR